jgi:hypothetical protein
MADPLSHALCMIVMISTKGEANTASTKSPHQDSVLFKDLLDNDYIRKNYPVISIITTSAILLPSLPSR